MAGDAGDSLIYEPPPKHGKISPVAKFSAGVELETDYQSYISSHDDTGISPDNSGFVGDDEYPTRFEGHRAYQSVSSRVLLVHSSSHISPNIYPSSILRSTSIIGANIPQPTHELYCLQTLVPPKSRPGAPQREVFRVHGDKMWKLSRSSELAMGWRKSDVNQPLSSSHHNRLGYKESGSSTVAAESLR